MAMKGQKKGSGTKKGSILVIETLAVSDLTRKRFLDTVEADGFSVVVLGRTGLRSREQGGRCL
jgi:hypothetical protein